MVSKAYLPLLLMLSALDPEQARHEAASAAFSRVHLKLKFEPLLNGFWPRLQLISPFASPPHVRLHPLFLPPLPVLLLIGSVAVQEVVGHHLEVALEAVLVGAAGDHRVATSRVLRRRR